jgi:uncharacterized membrane protein
VRMFVAPVVIIAVSLPLAFNMVPPNGMWGFRTSRTMSSEAVWYPANRVAGIALACAGVVWLLAAFLSQSQGRVLIIGLSALGIAVAISFLYLRRL